MAQKLWPKEWPPHNLFALTLNSRPVWSHKGLVGHSGGFVAIFYFSPPEFWDDAPAFKPQQMIQRIIIIFLGWLFYIWTKKEGEMTANRKKMLVLFLGIL